MRRPVVEVHGVHVGSAPDEGRFIGTGWFISSDRRASVVATAGHVCDDEATFTVTDSDGDELPARRVYRDRDRDICLLYVAAPHRPTLRVSGIDAKDIWFGMRVWTVGFPQGTLVAFDGRISAMDDEAELLVLSIPVNPGASGSPVVHDGRVVSMAVRYNPSFPSVGSGVYPEHLRRAQWRADRMLWLARRSGEAPPEL